MQFVFDRYARRARVAPALLTLVPALLGFLGWFPEGQSWWGAISGLVLGAGGTLLLAEMARDRGKRKEPYLFKKWGGAPTTRLLRHRDTANSTRLMRLHSELRRIMPDVTIPSAEFEAEAPDQADEVYETVTARLIQKTRDKKQFPLVFEELCSYGFRRNLWGLKPFGVISSIAGIVAIGALAVVDAKSGAGTAPSAYASGIVSLLFLVSWLFWFTPSWVQVPADSYATQLLASSEALD